MSRPETHSFFTKKPMKFEFKITAIECVNEGDIHSDGDFFGVLQMGLFGKSGTLLSRLKFMDLSDGQYDFQMYKGQRLSIREAANRLSTLTYSILLHINRIQNTLLTKIPFTRIRSGGIHFFNNEKNTCTYTFLRLHPYFSMMI